jgi:hypothetical protein
LYSQRATRTWCYIPQERISVEKLFDEIQGILLLEIYVYRRRIGLNFKLVIVVSTNLASETDQQFRNTATTTTTTGVATTTYYHQQQYV